MSKFNKDAKFVNTEDFTLEQLKALEVNRNCKLLYRNHPNPAKGEFTYSLSFPITERFSPEFEISKDDFLFMTVVLNVRKTEPVTKIACPYRLSMGIRGAGFGKGTEKYYMVEPVLYMGHDKNLDEPIIARGFIKPKQMIHLSPELLAKFEDRDV